MLALLLSTAAHADVPVYGKTTPHPVVVPQDDPAPKKAPAKPTAKAAKKPTKKQ